jgi:ESX secretion-associated protein EspG
MSMELMSSMELSRLEFDVVWRHLGLGAFPTVFRMLGHGRTEAERRRLIDQAWQSLSARGLSRHGAAHPMLVELLTVLSRPEREVDVRMNQGELAVRALAGARDQLAAIGVLRAGTFRLWEITPGGLSRAVVALLPEHPAGGGISVTLPSGLFAAACAVSGDDPARLRAALAERGVREPDAEQLATAFTGITGAGQFGAARLDRLGRRQRAGHVVGFVDSAGGRYLLDARPPAPGGGQWTTIAPTDSVRLAGQISRLLAEAAG